MWITKAIFTIRNGIEGLEVDYKEIFRQAGERKEEKEAQTEEMVTKMKMWNCALCEK